MSCSRLFRARISSPIGELSMTTCDNGLHTLEQSDKDDANFVPDMKKEVALLTSEDASSANYTPNIHEENCVNWLQVYFTDLTAFKTTKAPTFCFAQYGKDAGNFRQRVWITLAEKVHSGSTISYGELAQLSGSRGAAQSVGTAMAANPIQLIIPCHRVVRNDGAVGQYGSGRKNKVKLWLLNYEGLKINERGFIAKK